jgi:hypothetical protein
MFPRTRSYVHLTRACAKIDQRESGKAWWAAGYERAVRLVPIQKACCHDPVVDISLMRVKVTLIIRVPDDIDADVEKCHKESQA